MIINQRKSSNYIMPRSLHFNGKNDYFYVSVSMGAFDWQILLFWLLGKKCCRVWIGTDVLKVTKIWHYRWRAKLCSFFCENVTVSPRLTMKLMEWGIKAETIQHVVDLDHIRSLYPSGIKKNNRKNKLNILFYMPKGHMRGIDLNWLYGTDILMYLSSESCFNFKIVNGDNNKGDIYNYVDVLLRPTAWDGESMMIQEAKALGIPVIWTFETGKYEKPDISKIFNRLMDLWKQKNGNSL